MNIKKFKIEIIFILLGLLGLFGMLIGLVFSADFTQFTSIGGAALSEKEQTLLNCFSSNKKDCLKDVETIQYGEVIWQTENVDTTPKGVSRSCYDDKSLFCEKYGGYYTFEDAIKVCDDAGMHLPTTYDFQYLYAVFKNQDRFIFDMNLFPAGAIIWGESSRWEGQAARYWAMDSYDRKKALYYGFTVGKEPVVGFVEGDLKLSKLPVRCVKYSWE